MGKRNNVIASWTAEIVMRGSEDPEDEIQPRPTIERVQEIVKDALEHRLGNSITVRATRTDA